MYSAWGKWLRKHPKSKGLRRLLTRRGRRHRCQQRQECHHRGLRRLPTRRRRIQRCRSRQEYHHRPRRAFRRSYCVKEWRKADDWNKDEPGKNGRKRRKNTLNRRNRKEGLRTGIEIAKVKKDTAAERKAEQPQVQEASRTVQAESQPLMPLLPGEETRIEGGSTTDELNGEDEQQARETTQRRARDVEAWHKNTRLAEPPEPKKREGKLEGRDVQLRIDQLAYLTLWMKQDTAIRQLWESEALEAEKDVVDLAGKVQQLDTQLGVRAKVQCIKSQLIALGEQELEQLKDQGQTPDTQQRRTWKNQKENIILRPC